MKAPTRFLALLSVLILSSISCFANWYNHPVVTGNTILYWHSTYNDFNNTDFKNSDAPGGMVIPAANIRGITTRAPVIFSSGHTTHTRGGSFPIWNNAGRTVVKGWINVLVQYQHDDTTVISYTFNFTPNYLYPTNTW